MSEHSPTSHGPIVEPHDGNMGYPQESHGGHAAHAGGVAKYIWVFIALCFLTTLSFATYFDWWKSNFSVAESRMLMMAVSCTKAALVILCFMHIWWEASWKYILTIPAMLMSVFLILMLVPDVGMRMHHATHERRFYSAEPRTEPGHPAPAPEQPSTAPTS